MPCYTEIEFETEHYLAKMFVERRRKHIGTNPAYPKSLSITGAYKILPRAWVRVIIKIKVLWDN